MPSAHSPAPWTHDATWGLIMSGNIEVCALHSGIPANASLIIASPDLLAFAKAYVADMEEKCVALGWESAAQYHAHCQPGEPYPLAIAAIAKATLSLITDH